LLHPRHARCRDIVTISAIPCYSGCVTPRHIVLAAAAIAVLGMGVYLFLEVRSGSAAAPVPVPSSPPVQAQAKTPEPTTRATSPTPAGAPQVKRIDPATPTPGVTVEAHDEPAAAGSDDKANPKLDAIMDQANKAYDRQDYDEAKAIAGKVLTKLPTNIRMLRIMVSSSCIDGDVAVAQKYLPSLPKFDRDQLKVRCDRYGVTLTDPPQ
jgi:hypothetical protein